MKTKYLDRYVTKNSRHLDDCLDLDNLILKGHILSENLVNKYIETASGEKLDEKLRFTYAQKIEISKILGLFKGNSQLKIQLQLLNKLRNSIAHNFTFDKIILNNLLNKFPSHKTNHDTLMWGVILMSSWIEGFTDGLIECKKKQK